MSLPLNTYIVEHIVMDTIHYLMDSIQVFQDSIHVFLDRVDPVSWIVSQKTWTPEPKILKKSWKFILGRWIMEKFQLDITPLS